MRCLAVCQDELVIRMLDEILLPGFEVEFIIENRPLARRLHEAGVTVTNGDPRRTDTYLKADIGPSTCVIIEDNGKRSLKNVADATQEAKDAAHDLRGLIDKLQGPTTDFANNGLPQITAALVELQRAAESLQRLANEIQRSPTGVLSKGAAEEVKVKP